MELSRKNYRLLLALATVLGMVIVGMYTFLGTRMPEFQGLLPYGGSEEAMYLIRTQEALVHPFTNVTNGVWKGSYGLQSAGAEQLIGSLFWWTGLSGPWLVFFLHVLIAPLTIPLASALVRRVGANRLTSLLCAIFLFWGFVFCRRLFHGGFSIPLVLGTLLLLWRWYEKPTMRNAIYMGIPLGFAVGVYLWAWTFLWTTTGLLFGAMLFEKEKRSAGLRSVPWLGVSTILFGFPALYHLFIARLDPHYAAAAFRAGLAFTRVPESVPRSFLTVLIFLAAIWIFRKREHRQSLLPLLAMLGSLAVMYNQQLVHGFVMSFSSHYIQYVSLSLFLLIIAIAVRRLWTPLSIATVAVSAAVLALNMHDTPGRLAAFFPPIADAMRTQHLKSALDLLKSMPQTTILSDRAVSDIVASYTAHDTAFTEYSAFVLTSDEEYAERACLSELFAENPVQYETLVVHAEERLRVLRNQESEADYEQSVATAYAACEKVRNDPLPILQKYGVTHLLWDEEVRPEWSISQRLFEKVESRDGWSLWKLR